MEKYLFIDLFCGAGGVTSGIEAAAIAGEKCAEVIACVNHDPLAIVSHQVNHPNAFHFTEDIRTLDLTELTNIVKLARIKQPDAIICLWASLECTNFSKAKGGLPRDGDSRTLADHLYRYIEAINPDMIWIENVTEFQSWGPLDENGKPISKKNGIDYIRWTNHIADYGYNWDRRELNCADFGAYTSRIRLFMQFTKQHIQITWPVPTHAKKIETTSLFSNKLNPWKAVKDVLNFTDEGESIFNRKTPLVEKTLERIYAGLIKFVAKGDESFLLKYNSFNAKTGVYHAPSIHQPCPTVAVQGRLGLVKVCFIQKHFSGRPEGKVTSIETAAGTLTTTCNQSLISCNFISTYYKNGSNIDTKTAAPTITTKDRLSLITTKPFLMHAMFRSKGSSIDKPCFTLIARMDKTPPYLIQAKNGGIKIEILKDDSSTMIKIKKLMVEYQIEDILMRMLRIGELKLIQGFSADYYLAGNQNDQKKFIGNSVPPPMVKALIEASCKENLLKPKMMTA